MTTYTNPDGSTASVEVSYSYTPAPARPRTIVGLNSMSPDPSLAPYVRARRLFAGNALPLLGEQPASVLCIPSMPMRATGRPTASAMQKMLSRPTGIFVANHECNRPGKPPPAEIADNMAWCRAQIDTANATGLSSWRLAINFDSYPQMHGGATFDEYADAISHVDVLTWDIYVDLNLDKLPTVDALMTPYRASRAAYPHIPGGILELGVMARAPRDLPARQDAADLYAAVIDEVSADGGAVVCVWGTVGNQVDKVTGRTIDYTLVPGSPEHTVVRDRMRTQ